MKTLDLSLGNNGNITCEDQAVIRIDNSTVHTYESYCASSINNECVLSDDDLNSIVTRCNNNSKCTVDYPKNTSCLKEDRYFNLSYSCLGTVIDLYCLHCIYRRFKNCFQTLFEKVTFHVICITIYGTKFTEPDAHFKINVSSVKIKFRKQH